MKPYYKCKDCGGVNMDYKRCRSGICTSVDLREIKRYKVGDVVIDDEGRTLEITSGNNEDYANDHLACWNVMFLRAKIHNEVVETLLDLGTVGRDFLWYEGRIKGLYEQG